MINFISLALLLFILSGQSYAQWQNMNLPSTVRVNCIAVRDSNIFAATNGEGIFVSTDNGENWESSNEGLQSKTVHTVFINGTTVFAGAEKGAFVSTNNGLSWNAVDSGLSDIGVWSFAARSSKTGDSTLFAGTWSGVSASTDYGRSWKATSLSNTVMPVNSLSVYHNSVFASTLAGGVFYSSNNGFFWEDIINGTSSLIPVFSMAILDTTIFAGGGAGTGTYFYTSVNSPSFINSQSASLGNKAILSFAVYGTNIFAGNSIGSIFLIYINRVGHVLSQQLFPSLPNQAVYSLQLNNLYIFAGTGSGVWRLPNPKPAKNVITVRENPAGFVLHQNYPNPFNPSTTIRYSIPEAGHVTLKVYDELGREIRTLVDENKGAGQYEVQFNGSGLASGIYYYRIMLHPDRITAGKFSEVKELILMK